MDTLSRAIVEKKNFTSCLGEKLFMSIILSPEIGIGLHACQALLTLGWTAHTSR